MQSHPAFWPQIELTAAQATKEFCLEFSVRCVPALTWSRRLILILIIAPYHPVFICLCYLQSPECPLDFLLILGCDNDLYYPCSWIYHVHRLGGISHRHTELKVSFCFALRCRVSNKVRPSLCFLPNKSAQLLYRQTHFWNLAFLHNSCRHCFFIPKPFGGCIILCCSVETKVLPTCLVLEMQKVFLLLVVIYCSNQTSAHLQAWEVKPMWNCPSVTFRGYSWPTLQQKYRNITYIFMWLACFNYFKNLLYYKYESFH